MTIATGSCDCELDSRGPSQPDVQVRRRSQGPDNQFGNLEMKPVR